MDRRKFFSLIPALAALPAVVKVEPEKRVLYWAGTIIPRSTPWENLSEVTKEHIMKNWSGGLAMTDGEPCR